MEIILNETNQLETDVFGRLQKCLNIYGGILSLSEYPMVFGRRESYLNVGNGIGDSQNNAVGGHTAKTYTIIDTQGDDIRLVIANEFRSNQELTGLAGRGIVVGREIAVASQGYAIEECLVSIVGTGIRQIKTALALGSLAPTLRYHNTLAIPSIAVEVGKSLMLPARLCGNHRPLRIVVCRIGPSHVIARSETPFVTQAQPRILGLRLVARRHKKRQ